jgi:hypothetical protein
MSYEHQSKIFFLDDDAKNTFFSVLITFLGDWALYAQQDKIYTFFRKLSRMQDKKFHERPPSPLHFHYCCIFFT